MPAPKPTIVICLGVRPDGFCFNEAIPALQADGRDMIPGQYGLDSHEMIIQPSSAAH